MELREYSIYEIESIRDHWKELETGLEMTAFQSYDWYFHLNESIKLEKVKNIFRKCVYIVVFEDDLPQMIAPIQIVHSSISIKISGNTIGLRNGFYFSGRRTFTDYLNFIFRNFNPVYFDAILSYLFTKYSMNHFSFE